MTCGIPGWWVLGGWWLKASGRVGKPRSIMPRCGWSRGSILWTWHLGKNGLVDVEVSWGWVMAPMSGDFGDSLLMFIIDSTDSTSFIWWLFAHQVQNLSVSDTHHFRVLPARCCADLSFWRCASATRIGGWTLLRYSTRWCPPSYKWIDPNYRYITYKP